MVPATFSAPVHRGSPFGDPSWTEEMARELGLENTLRPRSRPKVERKRVLALFIASSPSWTALPREF